MHFLNSLSLMSTLHTPPFSDQPPPPPVAGGGFPMIAVAVIGITATAFILVSYYIFVTNCCSRWQLIDPLGRFSIRAGSHPNEAHHAAHSPSWQARGLNELLIRDIPTVQYTKDQRDLFSKCVVCLSEFQDGEMLRVLPKCAHAFHVDCIDVWLLSNSNCPICRSVLSGRNRFLPEMILAPNSSPQDSDPTVPVGSSGDSRRFLGSGKPGESCRVSGMGDGDGIISVQTIRRSFSMDSADDRRVYQSVQEIAQQRNTAEGSRSMRSIFSFGRGSRNAILPV